MTTLVSGSTNNYIITIIRITLNDNSNNNNKIIII